MTALPRNIFTGPGQKPWTTQGLDRQHRLFPNFAWLFIEGAGSVVADCVRGIAGTIPADTKWEQTRKGPVVYNSTVNDGISLAPADRILPVGGCTILLGYQKRDATLRESVAFGVDLTVSANACHCHLPWTDGTVYWDYAGSSSGTSRLSVAGLTFGDDVWAFTNGARGKEIWQNGIRRASGATFTTRTALSTVFQLGGGANASDVTNYRFFYIYHRELAASEIREISRDPYAFMSPQPDSSSMYLSPFFHKEFVREVAQT